MRRLSPCDEAAFAVQLVGGDCINLNFQKRYHWLFPLQFMYSATQGYLQGFYEPANRTT